MGVWSGAPGFPHRAFGEIPITCTDIYISTADEVFLRRSLIRIGSSIGRLITPGRTKCWFETSRIGLLNAFFLSSGTTNPTNRTERWFQLGCNALNHPTTLARF